MTSDSGIPDPEVPGTHVHDGKQQKDAEAGRSWLLSEKFAAGVMRVSVFLVVAAGAGGIFAVGILVGSTSGPWNTSTQTSGESNSASPVSVPSCVLRITGGGFDSLSSRSQAWSDLFFDTVPGVGNFQCGPDKDGAWTGTVTIKNSEKTRVTYTLTASITSEDDPGYIHYRFDASKAVAVDLAPGESRKVTLLSDFHGGAVPGHPTIRGSYYHG